MDSLIQSLHEDLKSGFHLVATAKLILKKLCFRSKLSENIATEPIQATDNTRIK